MTIVIPRSEWPGGSLLNVNAMGGRYASHQGKIKAWRNLGHLLAVRNRLAPVPPPARIWVGFRFPNNHRRDTANLAPTCKALVDGLVDAGVLPDDCDGIVEGPFPVRVYPNRPAQITLLVSHVDQLGGLVDLESVQ